MCVCAYCEHWFWVSQWACVHMLFGFVRTSGYMGRFEAVD